jgi:uncharacterized protein (TIGR00251 family)
LASVPTRRKAELAKLAVTVVPRSSRTEIAGVIGGRLKIRLAAPPVDGKANEELVKFLSKLLKVPKSDIAIVSGISAKRKLLDIDGIEQSAINDLFAISDDYD